MSEKQSLTKQQQECFEKFSKLKVGALFMQMGTGKTRAALEIVKFNNPDLLLYLAPHSTLENIEKEINKWGIDCELLLVGYESIASSDRIYLETMEKLEDKKCFVVADESIFIKNSRAKRFNRACKLREKCEWALILNGTPVAKNEWDIFNQMWFLSPRIIGMSSTQFLNTFFKQHTYKKRGETFERHWYTFSDVNADVLTKLIQPYVFNADLEFDKKEKERTYWVDYEDDEYCIVRDKFLNDLEMYNIDNVCEMFSALQKIASVYPQKNKEVAKYIDGRQVICYCSYLEEVKQISDLIDCYVITGATNDRERKEILEKFEHDEKPLILTFGVGAYSLNLQFCNEIVYSSITFDYGRMEQSKYRIKRTGQERDIEYTYYLAWLGINNMIFDNIGKKSCLSEIVKDKIQKGEVEEWLKNI